MTTPFTLTYVEQAGPAADSGLWNHPDFEPELFKKPSYWNALARQLEDAGFTALFIADMPSVGSDIPAQHEHQLRQGFGPRIDPTYLIPGMSRAARQLGFVVTSSITYDHPYRLARKFATLDHLTGGRVGWNMVTTNARQAALNHGLADLLEHDDRYDRGDEFLAVAYALWNDSWDDDAIRLDADSGVYIDSDKVRPVDHRGPRFAVQGIPVFAPSPQRTPVLFQAGSSERGREFAATHAEVVYLNAVSAEETSFLVSDIRNRAEKHGRDPQSLRFLPRIIPVVGPTRADAERKYEDFVDHHDEGSAAFVLKQWAGIDVDALPNTGEINLDDLPVEGQTSQHTADYLRRLSRSGRRFTKRDLLRAYAFGGEGNVQVGTGSEIVDQLERFRDETGVDGFNVAYMLRQHSLNDFVQYVVPELRARGLLETPDADHSSPSTLREKLTGTGPQLPVDHPGRRAHNLAGHTA
ncbi:NtaA/DmoA family FMN-dependent monooxygenase [Rhodococcus sp. KBS0724]|uniref:NtaA/DmoA family FMN-dependent monooxygenase n=1 Tax=Rhodococcus sp. KBS0724 TaxID=1179674 RepID=UPI00110EDB54|nr:NtaA/DmoA family FMN-dependent monooxygenase [Rhodococcus sp. KBS0724]TSD40464.1 NtaA/DmoA family FMN-dependent monooxygenase [Rhodococcus sp. KBS0724]